MTSTVMIPGPGYYAMTNEGFRAATPEEIALDFGGPKPTVPGTTEPVPTEPAPTEPTAPAVHKSSVATTG